MKKEQYKIKEAHQLIITTEDSYDNMLDEYNVIPITIKRIFNYFLKENILITYYEDSVKNKRNNGLFTIKLNKILSNNMVVFENFNMVDLDEKYILELAVIGVKSEISLEKIFETKQLKNIKEVEMLLMDNTGVKFICKIYDSSYIEIHSKTSYILEDIKKVLNNVLN